MEQMVKMPRLDRVRHRGDFVATAARWAGRHIVHG
jgi:hypothetical protein